MAFKKKQKVEVKYTSNIIQLDDMGYPLMLCIMSDGTQQWIDIGENYVLAEVEKGNFKILEWTKKVL